MELLTSTWMIVLYVIVGIIITLFLIGRKSAHTEITINAYPEKVWSVISDGSKYNQWNSVINDLEGELVEGKKVNFTFNQNEGKSYPISAEIKEIQENRLLNQFGGTVGVMTFDHRYIIEELNEAVKVTIHEDYRGIMVPFWSPSDVQLAYERLNEELKKRCEE